MPVYLAAVAMDLFQDVVIGSGSDFLIGIGFTMSIFISGLAFGDDQLLAAAKLSVLGASTVSAVVGLLWGIVHFRSRPVTSR